MGLETRQWFILLTFYTTYLMFGAAVFYQIEHELETERRARSLQERIDINELLVEYTAPEDLEIQNAILKQVSTYCKRPVTNYTTDEYDQPYQWTFYHSIFFAFTVCSTLGYGNIAPTEIFGRYFMIVYALIGMPVNMILYAYLGEYFGTRFTAAYKRYKVYKMANNKNYVPRRLSMIGQITLSLVPAAIVLIFLPSCLFTYFEGWPYSVSVYYSFVTLSTIGFGDFIPTFQAHQEREFGIYFQLYQGFVLIWFVFGLSYILMLIGFIAKGMRSKRIARLEHQLTENIKLTHNRIWHGVTKDVGYLRRILNEIYIMRFRPVYDEFDESKQYHKLPRSFSCPNLTIYSVQSPQFQRKTKRAMSENYADTKDFKDEIESRLDKYQLSRHSETNLLRINKEKTFMGQNVLDNTSELLAQVVLALDNYNNNDEANEAAGMDLFSEDEILEEEMPWSIISTPYDPNASTAKPPKYQRQRAKSLFNQAKTCNSAEAPSTTQWTWSGDNSDIQEYVNAQVKEEKLSKGNTLNSDKNHVTISIDKPDTHPEANCINPVRRPSVFNVFNNIFKRRTSTIDQCQTKPPISPMVALKRRCSNAINAAFKPHVNLETIRRSSEQSTQSTASEHILENTTIADLIRAIETAHLKNHLIDLCPPTKAGTLQSTRRASFSPTKRDLNINSNIVKNPIPSFAVPQLNLPDRSNTLYKRRSSLAPPQIRHQMMRQNSSPIAAQRNRFLDNAGGTENNLKHLGISPSLHNRRRFSAFPFHANVISTIHNSNQTTPNAQRRTIIKRPMSPLALATQENPFDSLSESSIRSNGDKEKS